MTNTLSKSQRDQRIREARKLEDQLRELTAELETQFKQANEVGHIYPPTFDTDLERRLKLIHTYRRRLTAITQEIGRIPPPRGGLTAQRKHERDERRRAMAEESPMERLLRQSNREREQRQGRLIDLGFVLPIPDGPPAPLPNAEPYLVQGGRIKTGPRAGHRELRTAYRHGERPVDEMLHHNALLDRRKAAERAYEAHRRHLLAEHQAGRIVLSPEDMAAIEAFRPFDCPTPYYNVVTGELDARPVL